MTKTQITVEPTSASVQVTDGRSTTTIVTRDVTIHLCETIGQEATDSFVTIELTGDEDNMSASIDCHWVDALAIANGLDTILAKADLREF